MRATSHCAQAFPVRFVVVSGCDESRRARPRVEPPRRGFRENAARRLVGGFGAGFYSPLAAREPREGRETTETCHPRRANSPLEQERNGRMQGGEQGREAWAGNVFTRKGKGMALCATSPKHKVAPIK